MIFLMKILQGLVLKHVYILLILSFPLNMQAAIFHLSVTQLHLFRFTYSVNSIKSIIKDEVLLTVSCPIFPSILIAKNLLTGSLRNRSIDQINQSIKVLFKVGTFYNNTT